MAWEIARVAIAAAAVIFLPGWLLLDVVRWELCCTVRLSIIPAAFGLSVAMVTLLGVLGHLAGVRLDTVLYVIAAIDCLALLRIVALTRRYAVPRHRAAGVG